jgi:hypothetical protein
MPLLATALTALALLLPLITAQTRFVFGPVYGWRFPDVKSYITMAETTICPGKPPSPEVQRASMWMGMECKNDRTGRGRDLIQAIIVSDPGLYRRYVCPPTKRWGEVNRVV